MLLRVRDLLLAGHAPHPGGSDDLQVRRKGGRAEVESDLVVPFARAAVGDGGCALAARNGDEMFPDERPGEGRAQGVLPLVHRVGFECREDELVRKLLAGIHEVRGCAEVLCLFLDPHDIPRLAHVDGQRDDVEPAFL